MNHAFCFEVANSPCELTKKVETVPQCNAKPWRKLKIDLSLFLMNLKTCINVSYKKIKFSISITKKKLDLGLMRLYSTVFDIQGDHEN